MRNPCSRLLHFATSAVIVGTCFQFSGCSPQAIGQYIANINPCGTILDCDPVEYRFITSGDSTTPACVFPPYCVNDPFVASPGAGG